MRRNLLGSRYFQLPVCVASAQRPSSIFLFEINRFQVVINVVTGLGDYLGAAGDPSKGPAPVVDRVEALAAKYAEAWPA